MSSLSISFPFKETNKGGVFNSNKTSAETTKSNLIFLLTIKRRQKVMNSSFYSPIYDYIFDKIDSISKDSLTNAIKEKIKTFMPNVYVSDVIITDDEDNNLRTTKILYQILDLGIQDSISIVTQIQ